MLASSHKERPIRVRMAPSPTGPLHVGGARTALFNWLFARKNGGAFVLRVDDTDKERSEKKYETELFEGLTWLGMDWDEGPTPTGYKGPYGPYRQSERTDVYKKYLEMLLAKGDAYYCYCTREDLEAQRQAMLSQGLPPKYNGHCRNIKEPPAGKNPEVIRFKVPEVKVSFKDLVRSKVTFDAGLFGDQVIAKDLDTPLYNFATVVDDELMEISHIIRGEEHLSNTPKQILMQQALGFKEPIYAHIPLLLNADRSKMSKRFSDVALLEYHKRGYLSEGMVNFLALLGWHPSGNKEVMSREELIKEFDVARVQQAGAVFNEEKLSWINKEHLKNLSAKKIFALLEPFIKAEPLTNGREDLDEAFFLRLIEVERSRANTLNDFIEGCRFFFNLPEYEAAFLAWKDVPLSGVASILNEVLMALKPMPAGDFTPEHLTKILADLIGARNRGEVLWPLRVALSGERQSPDPVLIMQVLGKDESLKRITVAIKKIEP